MNTFSTEDEDVFHWKRKCLAPTCLELEMSTFSAGHAHVLRWRRARLALETDTFKMPELYTLRLIRAVPEQYNSYTLWLIMQVPACLS